MTAARPCVWTAASLGDIIWSVAYSTPSPFSEDHGATEPDRPVRWSELTDAQYHLLVHAQESSLLWDALAFCVVNKDAADWEKHREYVAPLIAAARCLLQWDLLTVWRSETVGSEGEALAVDEAMRVLTDPRNWLARNSAEGGYTYELTPSALGQALEQGPPRDGDSRTVRIAHERRRLPTNGDVTALLTRPIETN